MLHGAVELLEKVERGELRLDRTIEISVTNTAEKKRVLKRIGPNLATIRHLLERNTADYVAGGQSRGDPRPEARRLASPDRPPQQGDPAGRGDEPADRIACCR